MIEFVLNNTLIKTNANTGMTLLHFIREKQHLMGTKSGCKEGDCGACTVLSGTLLNDNSISYKSITSCLTPLANVQNKHVVSIEGLNLDNELNVSQQAISDNHATQCGFCTPGFVVSLSGLSLSKNTPQVEDSIAAISGNICRCTGYKSIEKAAQEVKTKLQDKNNDLKWLVDNKFIPAYFTEIPEKLKRINTAQNKTNGTLIAGGTDIYVLHADALSEENIKPAVEFVSNKIKFDKDICTIGASATVTDLMENEVLNKYYPELKIYLKLVSSEQIRNMASLGGNFVNASPIGDMSIFFLALNSTLVIADNEQVERRVRLNDFFKDYKSFDLNKNEIIQNIFFDLPGSNTYFNFEKVSKRTHLDIASVNTAISIEVKNNIIISAHISIGGVAAIPKYLSKTCESISGKDLTTKLIVNAQKVMQAEISPISDIRGTEEYKRLLARQLFYAHFIKLFPHLFQLENLLT